MSNLTERLKRFRENKVVDTGTRTVGRTVGLVAKIIVTILLILICTGLIFVVIFATYVKNSLSDELTVTLEEFNLQQTSTLYYWDEDAGGYLVLDHLSSRNGNRTWVNYEELPKDLEHAAVAIEDKRFYTHYGVDWYRTVAAFGSMFLSMDSTFGGSTITQQVIKNQTHYDDVTVKRKLLEIFRALKLEKTYTKEQIIEWYLNLIYLGEGTYGVQTASKAYFAKDAADLTTAECACLIGITNNPSMYDPYLHPVANRKRTETILYEMYDQGYLTEEQYDAAMAQELVFASDINDDGNEDDDEGGAAPDVTSWFTDAVIEDVINDLAELKDIDHKTAETLLFSAGYKIYTTMDKSVQDIIDDVYSSYENIPSGFRQSATQDLQSSIVVMDPFTGDILGLSGGVGEKDGSRLYNRATQMLRSPGSTIKPIASYSLCIDKGLAMPYTIFDDSDLVQLRGTSWLPNNDTYSNSGAVTLRYALQRSINTVAAQMVDMLTPEVCYRQLVDNLGFTTLVDNEQYSDVGYAAMSLGQLNFGTTVREMCQSYTPLCNEGIYTQSRTYSRIEDASGNLVYENEPDVRVALHADTAYYMTEMLCNAVNRGTGWLSKFGNMEIAGKSGGSNDWNDRWFIAYTPYLLAAVWTGYDSPENMGSSNPATGMWKQVMERVHHTKGYDDTRFKIPEHMVRATICCDTGLLATEACEHELRGDRTMTLYMDPGTMPTMVCEAHIPVDICTESGGLFIPGFCPEECRQTVYVIDTSRYNGTLLTPLWFPDGHYPKRHSWGRRYTTSIEGEDYTEAQLEILANSQAYVLSDMHPCNIHCYDPTSGWNVSGEGYLIDPDNGLYYDIQNDVLIDPETNMRIDWVTGCLIDPETGEYIDPETGETVVPDMDGYTEDKYTRPPGYELEEIVPPEDTDTPTDPDSPDVTDGSGTVSVPSAPVVTDTPNIPPWYAPTPSAHPVSPSAVPSASSEPAPSPTPPLPPASSSDLYF